jgi:hypothetical protein
MFISVELLNAEIAKNAESKPSGNQDENLCGLGDLYV